MFGDFSTRLFAAKDAAARSGHLDSFRRRFGRLSPVAMIRWVELANLGLQDVSWAAWCGNLGSLASVKKPATPSSVAAGAVVRGDGAGRRSPGGVCGRLWPQAFTWIEGRLSARATGSRLGLQACPWLLPGR